MQWICTGSCWQFLSTLCRVWPILVHFNCHSHALQRPLQYWEVAHDLSCFNHPQRNGGSPCCEMVCSTCWCFGGGYCVLVEQFFWRWQSQPLRPGVLCMFSEALSVGYACWGFGGWSYWHSCTIPMQGCSLFIVGDVVYLQWPNGWCDCEWSGPNHITMLNSNVSIMLDNDGIYCHISHVWPPLGDCTGENSKNSKSSAIVGTGTSISSTELLCHSSWTW